MTFAKRFSLTSSITYPRISLNNLGLRHRDVFPKKVLPRRMEFFMPRIGNRGVDLCVRCFGTSNLRFDERWQDSPLCRCQLKAVWVLQPSSPAASVQEVRCIWSSPIHCVLFRQAMLCPGTSFDSKACALLRVNERLIASYAQFSRPQAGYHIFHRSQSGPRTAVDRHCD